MKKRAFLFSSLYYPNVGGVENSIKEFSFILKAKGYDVTVITSNRDNVNNQVLKESDCVDGIKVIRCDYPVAKLGFLIFLKNLRKKIRALNVSDYDFIISRSHWPALAARMVGLKRINYLVPSVYFFQEKLDKEYIFSSKVISYLVNSFGQFLAFFYSDVYVFSKDMQRQVKRSSLGVCNAVVLKPGVSQERFFSVSEKCKSKTREKLGLKEDVKYLLCVGRLSEIKRFDIAIGTLKYLDDEYHLLIVGSGPELESLKSQSKLEGVADRVTFYPFNKYVDIYYKAADVYLMTSRYESFGQVLLEATSCGLPVIAFSRASGVRTSVSYIYNGYNSLFAECHDQSPLSLGKTITNFKVDTAKFSQEVSAFRENYSWSSAVEKMML